VVEAAHFKTDTAHPVIEGPQALTQYDAIIVGSPTRFGRMSSQMASFWDTAGGIWFSGALNGKVGGAFTSTATDMAKWEAALTHGALNGAASRAQMWTPARLTNGETARVSFSRLYSVHS
jgi:multimeric flavodoxin WrbA